MDMTNAQALTSDVFNYQNSPPENNQFIQMLQLLQLRQA
jgi:hypothetical protein